MIWGKQHNEHEQGFMIHDVLVLKSWDFEESYKQFHLEFTLSKCFMSDSRIRNPLSGFQYIYIKSISQFMPFLRPPTLWNCSVAHSEGKQMLLAPTPPTQILQTFYMCFTTSSHPNNFPQYFFQDINNVFGSLPKKVFKQKKAVLETTTTFFTSGWRVVCLKPWRF